MFFPGGASGHLLKSNCPNRKTYADNSGLILVFLSKFNVRTACGRRRSRACKGNRGLHDASPAKK